MRRFLFTSLLFCGLQTLHAQEQRVFSQFFINPYIYNPAYAGVDGHTAVFMMYRNQWTGLEGSPSFYHVNFHTPLKGGISFGALAFSEEESVLKTSGFKATLGYLTAFDKKHYIRFGMSLGAGRSTLDLSQIDNPLDPAFSSLLNSSSFMIADFGATYHTGHFNIGFSLPNLISREVFTEDSFSKIKISPTDNMLFKINYRGHITHDFAIEPHLLYRYSAVNANQYEIATILHIKHLVWVGGSFRQDAGIVGLAGFKVKEKIVFGYAYELGNSDISSFTGATHEIHIGFHLGSKKKHHKHAHSFIKSHSLTPEERAKLAEKKRQERLAALQNARDAKTATEVEVEEPVEDTTPTTTPEENNEVEQTDNSSQTPTTNTPDPNTPDETEAENNATENTDNNTEENTENTDPAVEIPNENETTTSKNPNTVKRGNHFLELPHGNHIIAGAFKEFQHAEDFSDELFQRGFHDTIVGYVTAKGFYYVVIFSSSDLAKAESRKDRIKQMRGLGDAWVLTVE